MAQRIKSDYENSRFTIEVDGDELAYIITSLMDKMTFYRTSQKLGCLLCENTKKKMQNIENLIKELI